MEFSLFYVDTVKVVNIHIAEQLENISLYLKGPFDVDHPVFQCICTFFLHTGTIVKYTK